MLRIILAINLVASVGSGVAAAIALFKPAALSGSNQVTPGEVFYVRMYAARSIPLGLASGLLPFWTQGAAVACILFTAAAIQFLDIVIAARKRDRGMILGASIAGVVHSLSGFAIM